MQKPVPVPVQPLPPNGETTRFHKTKPIAPLEIRTKGEANHFIKLSTWSDNRAIVTVFVRAGQSVQIEVPIGTYRLKYVAGKDWYDPKYLFGHSTVYDQAKTPLVFSRTGTQVRGHTIELFLQASGNLQTEPIEPEEW
jgi:hypothetical protein